MSSFLLAHFTLHTLYYSETLSNKPSLLLHFHSSPSCCCYPSTASPSSLASRDLHSRLRSAAPGPLRPSRQSSPLAMHHKFGRHLSFDWPPFCSRRVLCFMSLSFSFLFIITSFLLPTVSLNEVYVWSLSEMFACCC